MQLARNESISVVLFSARIVFFGHTWSMAFCLSFRRSRHATHIAGRACGSYANQIVSDEVKTTPGACLLRRRAIRNGINQPHV